MKSKWIAVLAAATILAGSADLAAAEITTTQTTTVKTQAVAPAVPANTANIASAADVKTVEDESPVMLSGIIKSISDDEFVLSYGSGEITVEMDDWRWDGDKANALRVGERVTVTGNIDDDLFEGREIEANNIFVNKDNVYYYRTATNMNTVDRYGEANTMTDGTFVTMSGKVTAVNGKTLTVLDKNNMPMTIDLGSLAYDPITGNGQQRIGQGDHVQVYGEIDENFFQNKEIVARRIVTMMPR